MMFNLTDYRGVKKIKIFEVDKAMLDHHLEYGTNFSDYINHKSVRNFKSICRRQSWDGSDYISARITSSGWYLFDDDEMQQEVPNDDTFYLKVYRTKGKDGYWQRLTADMVGYFTYIMEYNVGDIVKRNNIYHEITMMYCCNKRNTKPIVFKIKSLITGTESYTSFGKLPKMKQYTLSERQKQILLQKQQEMKERIKLARSAPIELSVRKRLGIQGRYVAILE